nr:hypothetical protein [Tanacetum cinerariifolium]
MAVGLGQGCRDCWERVGRGRGSNGNGGKGAGTTERKSENGNNADWTELALEQSRQDNTAKTRRPQPRSNTKNDRVPSVSKSSCSKNKEFEVEEHLRNSLISKNKKHMSSECNNIKLAIRNDKSKDVCAMCYPNLFMVRRIGLFQAYDWESKASHQFRLKVFGNCPLRK